MPYGFGAALTWALDTVILGIALANPAFAATPQAIALAAFTSTFLHVASSAVFSFAYMGIRRPLGESWRSLRSKPTRRPSRPSSQPMAPRSRLWS